MEHRKHVPCTWVGQQPQHGQLQPSRTQEKHKEGKASDEAMGGSTASRNYTQGTSHSMVAYSTGHMNTKPADRTRAC